MKERIDQIADSMVRSGRYSPEEGASYSALMCAMNETKDPDVIRILGGQIARISAKISPDDWVIDLVRSGELQRIVELLSEDVDRNTLN